MKPETKHCKREEIAMEHLRQVAMKPYLDESQVFTLTTWDVNRSDELGKSILRYELTDKSGVVFAGEDFRCSPLHGIDSDESLRALLSFLTLRPGDTDAEYFENYTQRQLDFANEHGETLSMYAMDDDPQLFDETDLEDE